MAKRRGRKQRARRTLRRMGVAALVLFTVLLWPMGGMVDEAVPGEARSQVLAPEFTPEAATATAPVLTPSPEPTATPSPTATPVPEPQEITITFGGDCTLAGDVNKNNTRFQSFVEEYGYDYFLANLKPIFEADDLTIVNLEGPLTTSDDKRGGRQFNFRGDPGNAQILSAASVEAVHMANNHARDFQEEGYEDTLAAVEAVGIVPYGYAQTQVMEVKGVKIGLIGLTEWDYEPSEVREMVAQLREEYPDSVLGRPHFCEHLMRKGYISSVKEGFEKFLGEGKPYYLPKRRISIAKAVETIVAAGGVPVLAHPMQYHYPEPELIELIETAKALGIRALEAYYSEFSAEQTAWLLRAAEKYGMGVSGGSDYHGTRKTHISMGTGCGNLAIPYSVLEELKKLR